MTRKSFCRFVDVRRTTADNVVVISTNSAMDKSGLDAFFCRRVGARRNSTVNEERLDLVEERVLKELLLVAMSLRRRAVSM